MLSWHLETHIKSNQQVFACFNCVLHISSCSVGIPASQAVEEFCDSTKSHTRPSFRLNAKGAQPWEDTASRTSSRSFPSKTLALREYLCPTYLWTLPVLIWILSHPFLSKPPPQKKKKNNRQQRERFAFQPSCFRAADVRYIMGQNLQHQPVALNRYLL